MLICALATVAEKRMANAKQNLRVFMDNTRYGYRREYKGKQLRARGFLSSAEAEQHLNQAIADVDGTLRGEYRGKPTTAQDALNIYRRKLEVIARDKGKLLQNKQLAEHTFTKNMRPLGSVIGLKLTT